MLFSQVYSLQLVVDMRTGEVRSLRQQLAVANQQVDNYNHDKEGDLLLLTTSSGPAAEYFGSFMGYFKKAGVYDGKPYFKQIDSEGRGSYLYYYKERSQTDVIYSV